VNGAWVALYENIGRTNEALRRLNSTTEDQYPNKKESQAECRFLRAHWNFYSKLLFKHPVWASDSIAKSNLNTISNRVYTSDQYWDKIADDFQFAIDNLPLVQTQVGRASKVAAEAYLAKVRLYQAYEQDESNNVTSINAAKLQEVVNLCDSVINSGTHHLNSDFCAKFPLWI